MAMNPLYSVIKERTASAASTDAAFEARVNDFVTRKKVEKTIAKTDLLRERKASEVQKKAQLVTQIYHEPYLVATSTGLGTVSARANSLDSQLDFFKKIKEGQK